MTNTANNLTISGGQGVYPLAYIDTDRAFEVTFTSAQFTMDMFEMVNTGLATDGDVGVYESATYEVETGLTITLPFETQPETIKIRGLEYGTTAASGVFTAEVTAYDGTDPSAVVDPKTVITFEAGDVTVGDVVVVVYKRRIVDAHVVTIRTDSSSAKGEVVMHFPVYSSGDDCTAAAIKGVVHVQVPRMRVTSQPGFDMSYKSAATNAVTFAAIDARRVDKRLCNIIFEQYADDGTIKVATTSDEVNYN